MEIGVIPYNRFNLFAPPILAARPCVRRITRAFALAGSSRKIIYIGVQKIMGSKGLIDVRLSGALLW